MSVDPAPRAQPVYATVPTYPVWLTWGLLGAIGLVFLGQIALNPFQTSNGVDWISLYGAKDNQAIAAGELWRLITPIFIHGSLVHFGFNAYALYLFGRNIESVYGAARFGLIFFFAGVAGVVASLWFSAFRSVGASGGVFGLFAAEAVFLLINRPLLRGRADAGLRQLMIMGVINLCIGLIPGSNIDNWGHLGGVLGGALMAAWLTPRWGLALATHTGQPSQIEDRQPFSLLRALGAGLLWVGLLATAGVYVVLAQL
jgi:rhomboid protease GluP